MTVATFDIAEEPLVEGLHRLTVAFLEGDRHQHFHARRWAVIVPSEGEDEPFVLDDLAIDAAEPVFAVLSGLNHRTVSSADAEIDLRFRTGEARGPHPALHML